MMSPTNPQEDAKLDAMQRSWQSRRSRSSLFDDISVVETELLSMPQVGTLTPDSSDDFRVNRDLYRGDFLQAPFGPKPTFAAPQRVAPTPRKEEEVDAYTYNFHVSSPADGRRCQLRSKNNRTSRDDVFTNLHFDRC
jgi:hypothetical protein